MTEKKSLLEIAGKTGVLLVHYPVLNKNGKIVTTAVTNLDIHDISRASKSYGIHSYQLITPVKLQQELVNKIIGHWKEGWGLKHNPRRAQSFQLTRVVDSFSSALEKLEQEFGEPPLISYEKLRALKRPLALVFGTGWGLAPEILEAADYILPPIKGPVEYNHLSVRSAVSITLDRFLGF
jgi:hypothetical protein